MKSALLLFISIAGLLLCTKNTIAQHNKIDSLFARGDTTAVIESLMQDFDAWIDSLSKPRSFFSAIAGIGNRNFSVKNNSLNSQESTTRQLSVSPALGYYHKSGLGISAMGFAANINNCFHFYQYAITPAYDFIGTKISTGISYTRYLGKDTSSFNSTPYDNDWYAYFNFRRHNWRYGIAIGYASGNFHDKITYTDSVQRLNAVLQRYEWIKIKKTINADTHIHDFSLSASVRKDLKWYGLLSKTDNIVVSVTGYLIAGLSKLNSNTSVSYAINKINLSRFRKTYNSADGNGFQLQSAAFSASAFYSIGQFDLQPIIFMDYYFPDTDKKFNTVFSFCIGWNF